MKRTFLLLTAIASLTMANMALSQTVSWQSWNIVITDFRVTETVDMENMFEKNPVAEGAIHTLSA